MKKYVLLLFLSFLSFSSAKEEISSLEKKFLSCNTIEGNFIQETYIKDFDEPQIFKGFLQISKENKIKIEYKNPINQIIFVEGNKSIVYTPDENQAVVSTFPEDFLIVKIFKYISQNKSLKNLFNIEEETKTKEGLIINLKTEDSKISSIKAFFDKKNNLKKIEILDNEQNKVIIIFDNLLCLKERKNINLTLPKNTQIITY